jgi:hypothetical protein
MYFGGGSKLRHGTGGRLVYGVRESWLDCGPLLFEKLGGRLINLTGSANM